MTEITMPQLSDSMEQGLVLQWLIADGTEVAVGDELVEIETDKATMTYEAEVAGTLSIAVPEGTTVDVGAVIATVGAAAPNGAPAPATAPGSEATDAAPADDAAPASEATPEAAPTPVTAHVNGNGRRAGTALATPVARRLAEVHGIALDELHGTGPRGRITKSDVLDAGGIEAPAPAPARRDRAERAPTPASAPAGQQQTTAKPPAAQPGGRGADRVEELTRLQQVIARRMAEAKSTIPHFQVETEVEMSALLALRAELKAAAAGLDEPAPSINDLIVKACALALRRHPHANGSYKDGRFELHERVNVGVAVAADGALVVPTVFDADTTSLAQIARETRRLAERVRAGSVTPPELSGATFTVSNLGMFGMTAITPVINPPQAAILGVGATRETLARGADGAIVDRPLMTLTLSCDHRILYGADAARFLAEIRTLLETPLLLAFG
jgi:pyruvate dehydrogenase E2 component (dihydrolipoamide acetyltransferase)